MACGAAACWLSAEVLRELVFWLRIIGLLWLLCWLLATSGVKHADSPVRQTPAGEGSAGTADSSNTACTDMHLGQHESSVTTSEESATRSYAAIKPTKVPFAYQVSALLGRRPPRWALNITLEISKGRVVESGFGCAPSV